VLDGEPPAPVPPLPADAGLFARFREMILGR
jgi:hypothetical protein